MFLGWWMILSMVIIQGIHAGCWYYGLSAFIVPLTQEFGWTRAEISFGIAFTKVDSGLDGPIVGWVSDRYGPRRATFFTTLVSGSLLIALSLINSLWSFYAIMVIVFFLPTSPATAMANAVAHWFNRKAGTAMGLLSAGSGLSGVLAPVLTFLILTFGWRTTLIIAGVLILAVSFPLTFVIKDHRPEAYGLQPDGEKTGELKISHSSNKELNETIEKEFTVREILKERSYWLIITAYSFSQFAVQAIMLHLIPYLVNIGFGLELAALGMSVVTFSSIAGRLLFGWLGDFIPKRFVFALSFAVMLFGALAFTYANSPVALFLALALFGPGMGGHFVGRMSIQRDYFGRSNYGLTQGIIQMLSAVPAYVGPVFAGWMYDINGSYLQAFSALIILWFIAIVIIVIARPPKRK